MVSRGSIDGSFGPSVVHVFALVTGGLFSGSLVGFIPAQMEKVMGPKVIV